MIDLLQPVAVGVCVTWLGAIGVGVIAVGLRLNNAVQKLAVVVDELGKQTGRNREEISNIQRGQGRHAERLAVLETRKDTP